MPGIIDEHTGEMKAHMTYKLNPIIEKIISPVRIVLPDESVREYNSGADALTDTFDKNLIISSISAENASVVIKMIENNNPATTWLGEEQSFF